MWWFKRLMTSLLLPVMVACNSGAGSGDSALSGGDDVLVGPFEVLVFSKTEGFRHASIEAGKLMIQELGQENGFDVETTEDASRFNPEELAQYDVVVFLNTTLDVLNEPQEAAFEDYIRGGGNFVGIHSAADTEHDWPFYGELVGAYFLVHPVLNQPGELRIEDAGHPSVSHLPDPWRLPVEEYYSFRSNPRGEVRVLMDIDENSYQQQPNTSCDPSGPTFPEGYSGEMGDHPMSWCHDKFAGRAWYTALGHEIYLYYVPEFRQHVLNGILTAARRVPATCAVNENSEAPPFQEPELEPCEQQLLP